MTAMDAGWIRGIGTLLLFASFVSLCIWAWRPSQRRRFDEAQMLPFLDEERADSAGRPER